MRAEACNRCALCMRGEFDTSRMHMISTKAAGINREDLHAMDDGVQCECGTVSSPHALACHSMSQKGLRTTES